MNAHTDSPLFRRIAEPIAGSPSILIAYTVFAVLVTFADFVLLPLSSESLRAHLVPYTGWVASMFYAFTIFFALTLIYQRKGRGAVRFGVTVQLLLQIAYGTYQIFLMTGKTFGNPYLTVSPWRPVWTILIPSIWILLLYSPNMNRFCRQTHEPHMV
jgi:hypothetical protein